MSKIATCQDESGGGSGSGSGGGSGGAGAVAGAGAGAGAGVLVRMWVGLRDLVAGIELGQAAGLAAVGPHSALHVTCM